MYFSIPNLRSSVVTEVDEPWKLKTATPPPYDQGKEAVIEFCNQVTTQHAMLSMLEGTTPGVRVTMEDNPPFKMHGLMVDYDNPLPDNALEYLTKRRPPDVEFMPNYLVTTASGNGRLVWEFAQPILFSNKNHMREFMKLISRSLKLGKWLGGLDTEALTNWVKYYELGKQWQAVDALASIPLTHLELWYFRAADNARFDVDKTIQYTIPVEDLAREVEARWPGRWSGPFVMGARGIRFWDPQADNTTAAVVKPDGMLCYTGNQAFVSWRQLFGAAFVEQYEADTISELTENVAYDGHSYWMLRKGTDTWKEWSKEDFSQELRVRGRESRRKPGQTCSEVDTIENYIKTNRGVEGAFPFLFFPTGIIKYKHDLFLNTSNVKALAPAPPLTQDAMSFSDGRTHFPLIYKLLRNMFADDKTTGSAQLMHLLSWLKYAYVNALERNPRPGQVVILAGPAGKGKTFLSWQVISRLLGGRTDAANHLVDGSCWTSNLVETPVMTIDDGTALADATALRGFTARVKRYSANPEILYNKKYSKMMHLPWFGRIVITCNLDAESLRILPDMDTSVADKVCLFKATDPMMEFGDWQSNEKAVGQELPAFGRFLVDWPMPGECVGDERRYGVKTFHHPDLYEESRQHGLGMILELLSGFMKEYLMAHPEAKFWLGSATQLFADLAATFPAVARELKFRDLEIKMGKLAAAQYNVQKVWAENEGQWKWRVWANLNKPNQMEAGPMPTVELKEGEYIERKDQP